MPWFVILVQNDEYEGSDEWWKKGEYGAGTALSAVNAAFADTYLTKNRDGTARRTQRVAVVGPGEPWTEFDVTLESRPATCSAVPVPALTKEQS